MADAASATPMPAPEEVPEPGIKDVSFGTFLSVGPKEYRNTTIVGFDSMRGTVNAVRRKGDSIESIQIPYEKYKGLIEAQKVNDLATGRKTKKNLSKAIRGFFRRDVVLDGKVSQVIGYDGQSDEVLVTDEKGPRWMKSGEMLGRTAIFSAAPVPATNFSTKTSAPSSKIKPSSVSSITPIETVEAVSTPVESSEVSKTAEIKTSIKSSSPSAPAPAPSAPELTVTIAETREALKQQRSTSKETSAIQSASSTVANVSATIPASDTNATAIISAAQNVLTAYTASASARENQMQQISGQITEVSNRINDLQQRSRSASAGGNIVQAEQFTQQMNSAQTERDGLLRQQMNLQVASINEEQKVEQITEAVKKLVPDKDGVVPEDQIIAVQKLLPRSTTQQVVPLRRTAPTTPSSKPPVQRGRPAVSARPMGSAPVQTVKPILRALPIGNQERQAVDFNADTQRFRRSQQGGFGATGAGFESAFGDNEIPLSDGGSERYSGPLALPTMKPQTYAAGAGDEEPEKPDYIGEEEKAGQQRMADIHRGVGDEGFEGVSQTPQLPMTEPEMRAERAPEEPEEDMQSDLSRATLFQAGTNEAVREEETKKQESSLEAAQNAKTAAEKLVKLRQTFSRLWTAFDTAHGVFDIEGIAEAFLQLNGRLLMTFLKKDVKLLPKAEYPYEVAAIIGFDLFAVLAALMSIIGPIIVLTAIVVAGAGAAGSLANLFNVDITTILDHL